MVFWSLSCYKEPKLTTNQFTGRTLRAGHWGEGGLMGGSWGAVASARKTKCSFFFSNIVFDFAGLFLVAIFVLKSQENGLID